MTKFKRTKFKNQIQIEQIEQKELWEKEPWLDPDYDSQRCDKKRIPKPSEEDMFIGTCHIARKMKEVFGWKRWMEDFIDHEGNNKPYKKGLLK